MSELDPAAVASYLAEHNIRDILNAAVNDALACQSRDPLSAIAGALRLASAHKHGIVSVLAREILDSAGNPTIICEVTTALG